MIRALLRERDRLQAKVVQLEAAVDAARRQQDPQWDSKRESRLSWMHHHPRAGERSAAFSSPGANENPALVHRIIAAFRASHAWNAYGSDSMWRTVATSRQSDEIRTLSSGRAEKVAALLASPGTNHLLFGFEDVYRGREEHYRDTPGAAAAIAERCHDLLVRFAEAIGALRIENPEAPAHWDNNLRVPIDAVVERIEEALGIDITPPHAFAGACGLATKRGVLTDRALHGLHGAWRVRQILGTKIGEPVLEIGAGLGWLACYARRLGITNYTILDLPLTNVSQAWFLGHALGSEQLTLHGEPGRVDRLRIRSPGALHELAAEHFALIVNVDSLTEIGRDTATAYWRELAPRCDAWLSINHEANAFTVRDLSADGPPPVRVQRHPAWMRTGYVEELFEMRSP